MIVFVDDEDETDPVCGLCHCSISFTLSKTDDFVTTNGGVDRI